MAKSWQADVSFAERFDAITSFASQIQAGEEDDPKVARTVAKEREKSIYDTSTSLRSYRDACITAIKQATLDRETTDEGDDNTPTSASSLSIGKYNYAEHHRDGLFSNVFRARAPSEHGPDSVGQMVALKVTTPSMMQAPHNSEREARILKAHVHENVIPLLDVFQASGGRLILVFPFMPYDLQSLLDKGRLTPDQARSHVRDVFSGLAFLHQNDLIHRDVKPSNILLKTPSGPAYLADFGIAWAPNDSGSEPADRKITDVGTTCYRAPELLFGNKGYGCSLDLWAAGCVTAEACSLPGRSLFDAGELGSELALISSMFTSLGTPTLHTWPEAVNFPDWGKMAFCDFPAKPWSELLPNASDSARDLVSRLVTYESGERLPASKVSLDQALDSLSLMDYEGLEHPFFSE